MNTIYIYIAVAAAIAILVGVIMLSSQTSSTASIEKRAQYQQNGLNNQNPTQNVQNTPPNTDSDSRINENGFGDGDGADLRLIAIETNKE